MPAMSDLPLFDAATLSTRSAEAQSRCADCMQLGAAGWESLSQPGDSAHLKAIGTLREDPFAEPTLAEYHPEGTRYWSEEAPIAPAWFPYNRCEVAQCPRCAQVFLRYTEYGGYYQEARIRAVDPARVVDAPAPPV